jgi:uncharacterized protein YbaR (Trm112 family)
MLRRIRNVLKVWRQRRTISQLVQPGGVVLEVGSGNKPGKHATICLDKFVSESLFHRHSGAIQGRSGKPFILGDGSNLPFKDKSLCTVICRQVIEHVDEPASFLKELQRVGVNGYIEWPSIFSELIRGGFGMQNQIREMFPDGIRSSLAELAHGKGTRGHKWFITSSGSRMYFHAKTQQLYPLYLMYGNYAKSLETEMAHLLRTSVSYCTWTPGNPLEAVVLSYGQDNHVIDSLNESYDIDEQVDYLKNQLSDTKAVQWLTPEYLKLMCCPVCKKGDLENREPGTLSCTACGLQYPVIKDIPVLIEQAAKLSA